MRMSLLHRRHFDRLKGLFLSGRRYTGILSSLLLFGSLHCLAGPPSTGNTSFDDLYSGTFVDLTGIQAAGSTGLTAADVDGYDFTVFSSNNNVDCGIGIEPFTGETALVYGYSETGSSLLTAFEVSVNGSQAFNLHSIDICWDNGTLDIRSVTLTGYKGGSPVGGATLSENVEAASGGGPLVTFDVSSITAFQDVDMVRITVPGSDIGAIGVDNVNINSLLPLKLLSFNGEANTGGVALSWETSDEVNTAAFEIQRAADPLAFATIGTVPAIAHSTSLVNRYHYQDGEPSGTAARYYRLKMEDLDGRFTYSPVLKISPGPAQGPLGVCPNPCIGDRLYVRISKSAGYPLSITILNMTGQAVLRKMFGADDIGANIFHLDIGPLHPGIYALQIRNGDGSFQKSYTFMKQ